MSRWRIALVVFLITVPLLSLAGLGSYFLWSKGLSFQVWWPMAGCMILGYVLAWYWQRKKMLLRPVDFTPPLHWTERDKEAWALIQARADRAGNISSDQMVQFQFYVDEAQAIADELAHFYHPRVKDPISALTIPEILAVIELAAHDMGQLVDQYLPGGHLLTINDWRRAKQVSDWYRTASNAYWLVSAIFSPINTGIRYSTSKMGMSRPFQLLQQNLLTWFYAAYVHRIGSYLIDLNSGRLRVGALRYQELTHGLNRDPSSQVDGLDAADRIGQVTVTVMGQVKAGKSSLINALLGEQRAKTDVLPTTNQITRYELQPEGIPTRLVILDTVGYGHSGPDADQLRATEEAARQSDLLLLVVQARNPAREADRTQVEALKEWFGSKPDLKMPPIIGVMTHIDLLAPAIEWSPPYDWTKPKRSKEIQIRDAWTTLHEQFGNHLAGVVPVCTGPGKVFGVHESLLPSILGHLDEARAVAMLRCLRAEANTGRARKVLQQLRETGLQAARILWESTLRGKE
jgi:small GTP-binding protein